MAPYCGLMVSVAVSEDAQQVHEHIDKVKIEAQGAEGGQTAYGARWCFLCHALDLLGVPCGEAYEDEYAAEGDGPFKAGTLQKDVDDAGDDEADESHEQERAYAAEVSAGEVAVDAHGAEGAGGDEECLGDGHAGVYDEYGCKHHAVDHGKEEEQNGGRGGAELIDAGADADDQAELDENQTPHGP